MKKLIVVLLLAGTVTAVGAATIMAQRAEAAERERRIAEANVLALSDTVTMYEDSISRTVSLMQTQSEVMTDSILQLLGSLDAAVEGREQVLASLQTLRVEYQRLRDEFVAVNTQPVKGEPGAEETQFDIAGPPIEGSLWVTSRPNAPWSLQTDLGVTPYSLTYTIGCQQRAPVVNVTTPPWVRVTPERGAVSPDVCNPVEPRSGWGNIFRVDVSNSIWFTLGGIAGYFIRGWVDGGGDSYYGCSDPEFCYGGTY